MTFVPRYRRAGVEAPGSTLFSSQGLFFLCKVLLLALGAGLVVLLVVAGILVYKITSDMNLTESVSPSTYLLTKYVPLDFKDPEGLEHEGWLLLGLPRAPVIVLCHGYDSNRAEILSQGIVLQQNHFNVYLFNLHPKSKKRLSDLGTQETKVLLSAIQAATQQDKVNPNRVGVWGVSLGGYAALAAAQQSESIEALAVDSVYATPRQMMAAQVDNLLGGSSSIFRFFADLQFSLFNLGSKGVDIRGKLSDLEGLPKFFIVGRNAPALAALTQEIYEAAPQPKRILVLENSRTSLLIGQDKKEYENQVLNFFLQNLPLHAH